VANAGPNQNIFLPKDSVFLDGTASKDPNGSITGYLWKKLYGPAAYDISNPTAVKTIVKNLTEGDYTFKLTVTDDEGLTASDTVHVKVYPSSTLGLVANAGPDQSIVLPKDSVVLDGTASVDPDGTITEFSWSKTYGPASYVFTDSTAARTTVKNLVEGTYQFELTVKDDSGSTATDIVQVYVTKQPDIPNDCNGSYPSFNVNITDIGNLSDARLPSVAAAGTKIVFAGGTNRRDDNCSGMWCNTLPSSAIDIYDVNTHSWSTAQLSQARQGMGAVSCGNKLFFAGGANFELYFNNGIVYDNVDIYDVSTNSWTVAHLSQPRTNLTAAALGNKVLFAGGTTDGGWSGSRSVDIYDLSTNSWATAELSVPRYFINAFVDENKIYFMGGEDWENYYSTVDIYDISTNSWSTSSSPELYNAITNVRVGNTNYWIYSSGTNQVKIKNMTTGAETVGCASSFQGIFSINNEIIFPNGYSSGAGDFIGRVTTYNTVTGQWSAGLLIPNISSSAAMISINNTVYMGGGSVGNHIYTNKVYALTW
jgi:hypothetical protein